MDVFHQEPMRQGRDTPKLSPREQELINLAANGHIDAAIASHLGISEATVRTYWGRVRIKLGPYSRTELVAIVMRQQSEDEVALLRSEKAALVQQLHDLASQAHVDAAEGLSKVSADVISIFEKSVAQLSGKGDGDPLFFKKENFHDSLAVIRHELALTHRRRCVYPATESGRQLPSYRRKVKRGGSARRKLLEARLRALLELFPDAILVTDARTGDIKDFNESACEMFDYTSVEMSTLNVDDLVPAGRRAAHADTGPAFFATAQKRSHGKRTQMLALRRDGSEIEIEVFLADAHSHGEIFAICSGRLAS